MTAAGVLVVGVIAAALPASAGPADEPATLVLSASRSVQATFTLPEGGYLAETDAITVTGGGKYVAGDLRHVGGHVGAQIAVVRSFTARDTRTPTAGGTDAHLPGGTFTLTLLTDGPATVTVLFKSGITSQRLKPSRNVASTLRAGTAPVTGPNGAANVAFTGAIKPGQRALLVGFQSASVRVARYKQCASTDSSCPSLVPDYRVGVVENRTLTDVLPASTTRNVVFSVDGVRSQNDVLQGAALIYG